MVATVAEPAGIDARAALSLVSDGPLIGGRWGAASSASFAVFNPATDETLRHVSVAGVCEGIAAVDAAHLALESFKRTSPRSRADILLAAYVEMQARETELATLISLEMGKPLVEARAEVRYAADYLRWFAEQAPRVGGEHRVLPDGTSRMLTTPRPVGVCVLVTPWNFPAAMITRKLAPAIAAGCTTVVKPAEDTPLTTLALAQLFERAGLPPGVLNVVPSDDPAPLVAALLADGRARKLSFTGSTEVGRHLLGLAAPQVMRTSMELGGNAPFIVCEDADLELALDAAMVAKFRNGGQACTAANRFLVHEKIVNDFSDALVERISVLNLGQGLDPDTTLGPLIHHAAVTRTHRLVRDAVERGATIRTGGDILDRRGSFYQPTVLTGVPGDADVSRQEVFAPVVPISTFTSTDEALALANSTEFGLVAYLFTADADLILRAGDRLDFGMVAVNRGLVSNAAAPFGGIKHSGLGREGSTEGIDEYLDYTYTALSV